MTDTLDRRLCSALLLEADHRREIARAGVDDLVEDLANQLEAALAVIDAQAHVISGAQAAPDQKVNAVVDESAIKRAEIEALLANSPAVMIVLDARRADVEVPDRFKHDDQLKLRIGYRLEPPIDLQVTDVGIEAVLQFAGVRTLCRIPWPAIWAAAHDGSKEGLAWPNSVPLTISQAKPEPIQPEKPRRGPHLKLVD